MKKKVICVTGLFFLLAFIGIAWAATFMWDAPTSGGAVEGYNIHYRLQGTTEDNVIQIANVTQFSSNFLDQLSPGYYEVWVTAFNHKLDGTLQEGGSSNTIVYTVEVQPPGACTNFRIE